MKEVWVCLKSMIGINLFANVGSLWLLGSKCISFKVDLVGGFCSL